MNRERATRINLRERIKYFRRLGRNNCAGKKWTIKQVSKDNEKECWIAIDKQNNKKYFAIYDGISINIKEVKNE